MTTKRLLATLILSAGLYASDKAPLTDGEISTKVQLKLAEDTTVKGGGLSINVKDGVVTLAGKVENPNQKAKAEKLAKKVSGVKSVVNNIVVTHAP
jgi:hyperosmotically inducible periplasmic protein